MIRANCVTYRWWPMRQIYWGEPSIGYLEPHVSLSLFVCVYVPVCAFFFVFIFMETYKCDFYIWVTRPFFYAVQARKQTPGPRIQNAAEREKSRAQKQMQALHMGLITPLKTYMEGFPKISKMHSFELALVLQLSLAAVLSMFEILIWYNFFSHY